MDEDVRGGWEQGGEGDGGQDSGVGWFFFVLLFFF